MIKVFLKNSVIALIRYIYSVDYEFLGSRKATQRIWIQNDNNSSVPAPYGRAFISATEQRVGMWCGACSWEAIKLQRQLEKILQYTSVTCIMMNSLVLTFTVLSVKTTWAAVAFGVAEQNPGKNICFLTLDIF